MQFSSLLATAVLAPAAVLGAPSARDGLNRRDNLCHLNEPPALCEPDPTVTVEETARRAYEFYRAFILDGDPETMFSLIDSVYEQHNPAYQSGPGVIWPLFCNGNIIGTEANTAWCFDASTNMSYAQYSVTDRWEWVGGCVHAHWDQGETIPAPENCYELPAEEPAEETPEETPEEAP